MDGWSLPVLVRELLKLYAQNGSDRTLPRVARDRNYLAWITQQDHTAAEAAWRDELAGVADPTRLASHDVARSLQHVEKFALNIGVELTKRLVQAARDQGLTLNTFMQAAWAILIGRLTNRLDVVFGITVAGRPPEISGIETTVGLFVNTLPLRVALPPTKPILALLKELQDSQSKLFAHQHLGLAEMQGLLDLGDRFDTLLDVRELSGRRKGHHSPSMRSD